jgi:hypothetical protein
LNVRILNLLCGCIGIFTEIALIFRKSELNLKQEQAPSIPLRTSSQVISLNNGDVSTFRNNTILLLLLLLNYYATAAFKATILGNS